MEERPVTDATAQPQSIPEHYRDHSDKLKAILAKIGQVRDGSGDGEPDVLRNLLIRELVPLLRRSLIADGEDENTRWLEKCLEAGIAALESACDRLADQAENSKRQLADAARSLDGFERANASQAEMIKGFQKERTRADQTIRELREEVANLGRMVDAAPDQADLLNTVQHLLCAIAPALVPERIRTVCAEEDDTLARIYRLGQLEVSIYSGERYVCVSTAGREELHLPFDETGALGLMQRLAFERYAQLWA